MQKQVIITEEIRILEKECLDFARDFGSQIKNFKQMNQRVEFCMDPEKRKKQEIYGMFGIFNDEFSNKIQGGLNSIEKQSANQATVEVVVDEQMRQAIEAVKKVASDAANNLTPTASPAKA